MRHSSDGMDPRAIDWTDFPTGDVDAERLSPLLRRCFVPLDTRPALQAWAKRVEPHGIFLQRAYEVLRGFASDFDLDAWLDMHALFLLDTESWESLIGKDRRRSLLDIGAGRGDVTAHLARLFDEVWATETSRAMVRRLAARGYRAIAVDLAERDPFANRRFSVVSLLNVLDRCPRPRTLIDRALGYLDSDGLLILATPLPFRPHVDLGSTTIDPDEPLAIHSDCFETAMNELTATLSDVEILRWTRIPYVSQGDLRTPLVALDAALLVGRKRGN